MIKCTMMSFCLMAGLGALFLEVQGNPTIRSQELLTQSQGPECELAKDKIENCVGAVIKKVETKDEKGVRYFCPIIPEEIARCDELYKKLEPCFTNHEKNVFEIMFMVENFAYNIECSQINERQRLFKIFVNKLNQNSLIQGVNQQAKAELNDMITLYNATMQSTNKNL